MAELLGAVTRNLAPYFDESKGAKATKNWLAFVGRGGGTINYENEVDEVSYEITRGSRRVAKLVRRSEVISRTLGANQKNLGLGEYTQVARSFPLSVEEYDIQADKLTKKVPGERTEDSGVTRQDRMTHWAAKGQTELMSTQIRLMNYLAGQGILTGYQEAILGTTDDDEKYDFYRKASHQATLGTPWKTNPTTCEPLTDLDTGCDALIADSGQAAEFALMGDEAIKAMLSSTQVKELADNHGYTAFHNLAGDDATCPAKFKFLTDNGWECRGSITTLKGRKLWIFDSEELLELVTGTTIRSMPSAKVVLGNTESRLDAQYGPPETFPDDVEDARKYQSWFGFMPGVNPKGEPKLTSGLINPLMFVLDAYKNVKKTLTTIRSQCAPLYVPVDTDSWYIMENAGE